ncbi:MAG: hypothetical protein SOX33_02360 [Agathobacter sp.]|nr:hypothetical protein [Agathobacter sp.]
MASNNEGKTMGLGAEMAREGYETSVVSRMAGRAGAYSPKGSAGNALEIMANDKSNLGNLFKPDTVTKLTKSSTATQVDAVTTQAGKVIERIQYKDTVSPAGVQKTLNQVKSGKYQQAQLRGTIEAAEKYNAAAKANGVTKTMQSTGISHNATQRVGDKFTKQPIKAASLGDAVKGSTAASVGITAVVEVGKSIANGDTVGECTGHVVSKGTESALTAAAATVAAEATASAVGGLLATSAIPVVGPAVAGIGAALLVGGAVGEITDGVFDEVGSAIGDAVDDVVSGISDFVGGLFWWA